MATAPGGLLTLPILMFQDNLNNPNPDNSKPDLPEVGEPRDLNISVDILESKAVAVIPKWVVIVYFIMSTAVYSCCVGAIF